MANNVGTNAAGGNIVAGTFDGRGNIVLGSGGGGSVLTINSNATFGGTIDSDGNDDGVININAGKTVTFNSVVGAGQEIGEINLVGANSVIVFNEDVTATTVLTKNATAKIQVTDNKTITGAVDATAAGGILFFDARGTVTGAIGANNALTFIHATGAGAVNLGNGNAVNAATIRISDNAAVVTAAGAVTGNVAFTAAGTYNANGNLTGNVDFTNNAGTVNVADNKIITGAVNSTGGAGGNLIFAGAGTGTVTQAIGAANALTLVEANGAGVVQLGNAINTATLNVKNGATVKAADNSAAAIAAINIGEVGGAGTLEIDAKGGDYNLLNGTAITFAHADSKLKLTNTTNAGNSEVTLHNDLVPGGGADLKRSLEINSEGNRTLDVKINGGETIGTDNAHRLNEVIVSGDQDTTIVPNIFAKTIKISSTADVTFDSIIDNGVLDATSIVFEDNGGNLVLNGDVTTKTLNINNKTRTVTVDNGVSLNFDDILNGANSKLTFNGDSNLNLFAGQTVAVGTIEAAANGNTVNLGAGETTHCH